MLRCQLNKAHLSNKHTCLVISIGSKSFHILGIFFSPVTFFSWNNVPSCFMSRILLANVLHFHFPHVSCAEQLFGKDSSLSLKQCFLNHRTLLTHALLTRRQLSEEFPHIFHTPHFPLLSFSSHTDDFGKSTLINLLHPFLLERCPHSRTSLTDDFGKSPSRRTKLMMGGGALSLVMITAVMILDN